ncbi:transformer 2 beta [Coemansia sp. S142-1]|nr:transformer 2 beta [Coemansia sp. S142-1]
MARPNPILPSEPLSLEPNLIAAAVIAEELDNHNDAAINGHDLTPRNASKVKRRLDHRNFGRSESRGRSEEREHRYRDRSRHSEERVDVDRGHYSPRRAVPDDRGQGRGAGHHRSDEDRDTKRYRMAGSATEEGGQNSHYTHRRPSQEEQKVGNGGMQPSSVLGIFGMSKFTNEDALRDVFGEYGPVTKVQIIRDQHVRANLLDSASAYRAVSSNNNLIGYAFINMANISDAQKARDALNDTVLHDRRVRVDYSFTSRAHSPTPGKYKGQDTGPLMSRSRYANGRDEYRHAPYRPRRRANSRDRRRDRQQERHYAPSRGGHGWGRSKSPPGYYRGVSSAGGYQPPPPAQLALPPMLAMRSSYGSYRHSNHAEHGRGREYGEARGYGDSRSRSPPRRPAHGHHPDYHHGRSDSRNRYSRNEYRHEAYDRPPY